MTSELQKQYERGYPVEKRVRYTKKGWAFIQAYGELFGMTEAQAATHLLIDGVTKLIASGLLGKGITSTEEARQINRRKGRRA